MSSVSSDDGCSDWASDFGAALQTKSLFDETLLDSPEAALKYDQETHGFNLRDRKLDMYARLRLINCIRKRGLSGVEANKLQESDFEDEAYYVPVIPDDPLLQYDLEEEEEEDVAEEPDVNVQLEHARLAIARLQSMVDAEDVPVERDDDTHYFESYAGNDIHEVMLKDTTRTVSYGRYIQQAVRGKVVMDVGCGTGILSMIAARAGAEHVYAIEASGLAKKAEENVRKNGLSGSITVIRSKVEKLELDFKVDIIISEWMGYMLLYESMLDSVLWARDRFLKDGGVMAPSYTRLIISGITGEGTWKEQVAFWDNVYGFDMTSMAGVYFDEGIVETVNAKEVITDDAILKEIDSGVATARDLDFEASFKLTAVQDGEMRAFLTHFDTFFGAEKPGEVDITRIGDEYALEPFEGKVSFTTGPRGKETHWKQVSFLLKEPLRLKKGDTIEGKFFCRKADSNSRELDVEIHIGDSWHLYKVR